MARYTNKPIHPAMRDLMLAMGWGSLADVSKGTGISLNTIRGIAVCGTRPTLPTLEKLAAAGGFSAQDLMVRFYFGDGEV